MNTANRLKLKGATLAIASVLFVPALGLSPSLSQAQQQSTISELPNGNYRFCSDPPGSDPLFQEAGWCFRFRKAGDRITGNYFYAPMGEQNMCITGVLDRNVVAGAGLERWYGWSEPVSLEVISPQDLQSWDSPDIGGGHLIANSPSIVNAGSSSFDEYWAFIRYDSIQLNLNRFYRYTAGTVLPPDSCSSSGS